MGVMADLDIRLSEHKLSDPQKNGVIELMNGVFKETRTNTINSLFKRGVIQPTSEENRPWEFTHTFAKSMGWADEDVATSDIEEIEELLKPVSLEADFHHVTDGELDDAQAIHEMFEELTDKLDGVDTADGLTDAPWAQWELELIGVTGWRNTDVWTGLTHQEIQDDVKTAKPKNRKARREFTKAMTSVYRKEFCPRPRKALKLTGAVGV